MRFGQVTSLIFTLFLLSCRGRDEEKHIVLPANPPLSRNLVGYAVVTASYPHVLNEPRHDAISQGYVRRGSILPVLERRIIRQGNKSVSWVLIEGPYSGWLQEELIQIYSTESQARTASLLLR